VKRAEINKDYLVHFVFEAEDYPEPPWPPYPDGTVPLIVDLTGDNEAAEIGDGYNPVTGKIVFKPDAVGCDYGLSDHNVECLTWHTDSFSFSYKFSNYYSREDYTVIEDIVDWINKNKEQV